ncbi:MAG: bifunctional methylenetetrahydrofolate dehydrogenase/methenyltetrahydrofolate cyclohydrolase FolD [Chlamydiota bacterium]|nr:bifunctional methylenetetrahydrofolate dehydrogenase/methenyltetrahydrofolate cyclohydrolase FolD [Chlamydiota bacterium]
MIIDGKAIAAGIQEEFRQIISSIEGRKPCLAVLLVGSDPASEIYVSRKTKACEMVGINSIKEHLNADISETELLSHIQRLNNDPSVDGILVQLPLPDHINSMKVTMAISPEKDVDGFHPINLGKLVIDDDSGYTPCTPLGIRVLLSKCGIETRGKNIVIVGRSTIVGKPMASLFMGRGDGGDATVTIANRHTSNLKNLCLSADIIVAAVGQANFISEEMVKEGAIVIDVGINRVDDTSRKRGYRIVGDVDFENLEDKCSHITPVPGGVGPMTIAMLLNNTIKSFRKSQSQQVKELCLNEFSYY